MKIEFEACDIDELQLGIFMAYCMDEKGESHMTSIGFLFFAINLYVYFKD